MIFHVVGLQGTTFFRFVTNHAFAFDIQTDSFLVAVHDCIPCRAVKSKRWYSSLQQEAYQQIWWDSERELSFLCAESVTCYGVGKQNLPNSV